jgi:glycosyltransferase involved in cell wall biosynthesis
MLIWIGTTIGDERRPVLRWHSTARRWLFRTTLPPLERMETATLRRARRVLAQSAHTADVVRALGVSSSRIEVVPVPIEIGTDRPSEDARSGVLYVGRVDDPRKNFGAMPRLATESAAVRNEGVSVVAPGPRPEGLHGAIRWLGHVPDIDAVYAGAKVFVMPSRQEGLGIAAFEALAAETPVVALRCGGPDRFLADSGGAVVVDDERDLGNAVDALLTDDARRIEMGRRGREWVGQNMSATAFLENEEIFRL